MPETHDPFRGVKPPSGDVKPTADGDAPKATQGSTKTPEPAATQPTPPKGDDASPTADGAETPAQGGLEVPAGTSKEVLEWVGDDKERAKAALEAERASAEPRKGLTRDLEERVG